MTRGGRKDTDQESERRCITTGDSGPKCGLVRFVLGPDGMIWPDLGEKLPGRGIWVSADRSAIEKAAKKGLFARGAKAAVKVPDDLAEQVEAGLARRLVDLVSLARKAGQAVCGLEKTKAELVAGKAALLLQASDGSARGKTALRPPEGANTHILCLSAQELGMAFGRETVIHAALTPGGIAKRIRLEATRLSGLRSANLTGAMPNGATPKVVTNAKTLRDPAQ
ncbi:RNA-binding protein [Abyssibius alkaniclasticus]|uniref:RNA-binding protein n=1 Tax=Abyssibius alkaniclasticus TaxID=2881234 RepID=UPI0023637F47|nr:RNA-binding protein [Abyssibius alkaniclasticus]UPH72018.1 RNA-binding protein [Abyssibius alkaniclasticus]